MQYVTFSAGKEEYGLPVSQVISIEKIHEITVLPNMPDYIAGITVYRESVIPVINMVNLLYKNRFNTRTESSRLIITTYRSQVIGLLVEEVTEILDIQQQAIKKAAGLISLLTSFVEGFASTETGLITLLDPEVLIHKYTKMGDIQKSLMHNVS